jgi:microcystin-dependent protein
MTEPFLAEIRMVGFNFPPSGWASCNGQLLPISQNTALYSLLGTFYGGDGRSSFALPNLQSAMPIGQDGIVTSLGQTGGEAYVTLTESTMPEHRHTVHAVNAPGTVNSPSNNSWAQPRYGRLVENAYVATPGTAQLDPSAFASAGGGQPHNNLPPYLVVNFIIALQGIFPPRS